MGVNRICSILNISKDSYYNSIDPIDRITQKWDHVRKEARKVIIAHSAYGVRRLQAELENKGVSIGRDTLGKLLKLWDFSLLRKVRKHKPSMINKFLHRLRDKVNLLCRTQLTKPLQAITSDITKLHYNNGKSKVYLCIHKDAFGQMVYGWSLDSNMELPMVMKSLRGCVSHIKRLAGKLPKDIVWHQDQGSQYTSYDYVQKILTLGKISFSAPGTPTDNAGQESFFGRLKEECACEILELRNRKEVEEFIKKKLRYYNNRRLHTSIGYIAPRIFTKSVLKLVD